MSNKANEKSPNILVDTNENKKVLYTKHDELWVFVEQYLILLRHMGVKKEEVCNFFFWCVKKGFEIYAVI